MRTAAFSARRGRDGDGKKQAQQPRTPKQQESAADSSALLYRTLMDVSLGVDDEATPEMDAVVKGAARGALLRAWLEPGRLT